ncbi:Acyl-CoA dehydrogenase, short-chain specific [compost metagenome]
MQEACQLTLDYLKTRQQFGAPIGKFQALQHRMVDMRTELEVATSMAILAACVADQADSEERSRRLAAAKFIVTRAARFIAEQAIQLHGGIGMTWEYNLAHYAKRLVMLSHQLGDDDHHLQAYADLLQSA